LADAIDKYPSFLNTLFPGLTPRSRAFGSVDASIGVINRVVNVLVFDPGTSLPGLSPLDASLGYIVVVVQQDSTAAPQSSPISEACTTFQMTRLDRGITRDNFSTGANEAGFVYRSNPAADGTFTFMDYAQSVRDVDNDGVENTLDSCFLDDSPGWNPRTSDPVGDPDGDGIPGKDDLGTAGEQLLAGTGCDPTPLTDENAGDADSDQFLNRQDNCPLVANGLAEDNQADTDGDGIGDACDVLVNVPDGHPHEVCVTSDVVIGAGGSPPSLTCPDLIADGDNDGFDDDVETYVGTDPEVSCGTTGWPTDFVSGGIPDSTDKVTISDLASFIAPVRYFGTDVGTNPGDVRWDISPGPGVLTVDINIQDLALMVVLTPPILEGARAFNGPACPYP
jgi:hypothetical protein